MKGKRTRHDPEFKARVGSEALRGVRTIQDVAKDNEIHPVQVSEWKKKMLDGAPELFGPGVAKQGEKEFEKEREKLPSKIGQLSVEVDFCENSQSSSVCRGAASS